MIEHIKRMWHGEEKLWKVFWLWGVLGNALWFLQVTGSLIPGISSIRALTDIRIFLDGLINPITLYAFGIII